MIGQSMQIQNKARGTRVVLADNQTHRQSLYHRLTSTIKTYATFSASAACCPHAAASRPSIAMKHWLICYRQQQGSSKATVNAQNAQTVTAEELVCSSSGDTWQQYNHTIIIFTLDKYYCKMASKQTSKQAGRQANKGQ